MINNVSGGKIIESITGHCDGSAGGASVAVGHGRDQRVPRCHQVRLDSITMYQMQ